VDGKESIEVNWKHISKKKNDESFIGALRVKAKDEETKNFLKALVPEKKWRKEGLVFYKFPDGRIEVRTMFEEIQELVEEIYEQERNKDETLDNSN